MSKISQALKIIDPAPARLDECREDIKEALALLWEYEAEFNYDDATTPTKRSKQQARDLAKALRRVQRVLARRPHLAAGASEIAHSQPQPWLVNFPTDVIKHYVALCDKWADMPAPRQAKTRPEMMIAARFAADLLAAHDRELKSTVKGAFNRLVSVLLGKPDKDHTFVCRKVLAERTSAEVSRVATSGQKFQ
jgi:hypothetical protein